MERLFQYFIDHLSGSILKKDFTADLSYFVESPAVARTAIPFSAQPVNRTMPTTRLRKISQMPALWRVYSDI